MNSYSGLEFNILFSDHTLLESNGDYKEVCKIMSRPEKTAGGTTSPPPTLNWILKPNLSITHQFGESRFVCDFYWDGKIIIAEYTPSSLDIYNPDIRCFTHWCYSAEWKIPEPTQKVIEEWPDFWRMQWETHIIDSRYFDDKFGLRSENFLSIDDDNTNTDQEDQNEIE